MIILNIYKNIDKDNKHISFKLSDKFYNQIRQDLIDSYTVTAYNGHKLVDDNI